MFIFGDQSFIFDKMMLPLCSKKLVFVLHKSVSSYIGVCPIFICFPLQLCTPDHEEDKIKKNKNFCTKTFDHAVENGGGGGGGYRLKVEMRSNFIELDGW